MPGTPHRRLGPLVRDRALWRGALPWLLGLLVVANVASARLATVLEERRRANLLAGPGTSAVREGEEPRFDRSVGEDLGAFWTRIPDARRTPLVVLSGMSQMYAINDPRPGDRTIVEHLDEALAPGARAFGLAAPNLANEEALLLFLAAASDPATRPSAWIYGLCFDKFRNVELRPGYREFLRGRPALRALWRETALRHAAGFPEASQAMIGTWSGLETGPEPGRRDLEARLREGAARLLPLVAQRQDLNAQVQFGAYLLRNAVFRIEPTSKRPLIPHRYEMNRQFLGILADEASARGIPLILYVIPLNPQAENPYVPEEYAAFKEWARDFADRRGIPFANLEDAVPREDWGEFLGGPDFKHFRGEGHAITARALLDRFGPLLTDGGADDRAVRR